REQRLRVLIRSAAAPEVAPCGRDPVGHPAQRAPGTHVLHQSRLPSRREHPAGFIQGGRDIRDRAQHQAEHHGVGGGVGNRERLRDGVDDLDRHGYPPRRPLGAGPQVRVGLDRDDPRHRGRIVREGHAAARAHLDDHPREPGDQTGAGPAEAGPVRDSTEHRPGARKGLSVRGSRRRARCLRHRRLPAVTRHRLPRATRTLYGPGYLRQCGPATRRGPHWETDRTSPARPPTREDRITVDAADWNARYLAQPDPWGTTPAARVVSEVTAAEDAGLGVGTAVDLACGDGRHARWLAAHGWHVHAVDFSEVAIEQARDRDSDEGRSGSVDWLVGDAVDWTPPGEVELGVVGFLHLDPEPLGLALRRAGEWLRPGGHLVYL